MVSTGSAWIFLQLEGAALAIDVQEYYIDNLPKVLGILRHIVESAYPPATEMMLLGRGNAWQ